MENNCCRQKKIPRDEQSRKSLKSRLNRVVGQLNGIGKMLDNNRYCGDILIQLAAAEKALQSIGYIILHEHLKTCVAEEVKNGKMEIIDEAMDLIKKLK